MSGLRTLLLGLTAAASLAQGAQAVPASPSERAHLFATCTGRLSALEEHQWLFDGAASEATRRQKDALAALLDAVLPDAEAAGLPRHQPLAWRVAAKAAQAALLQDAAFATDPLRRDPSRRAADDHVADCLRLILGA